jgi:hypothetical protein
LQLQKKERWYLFCVSEVQLDGELPDAGLSHRLRPSKCRTIHVSVHCQELGVVKEVEKLCPKLQVRALRHLGVFQHRYVPVFDAGAVEETPSGIP